MKRARLPLSREAVSKADDAFYDKHRELVVDGKRMSLSATNPAQAGLRSEWMRDYTESGGAVDECSPDPSHPSDPVGHCAALDNLPRAVPADCPSAPETIDFLPDLNKQFDERWDASLPGDTSEEQGGTLVRDQAGTLKMINTDPANRNSGSFPVDRNIPDGYTMVGVFHTHPYSESEGGMTDVSLSGGDSAYMVNNGDQMIIAQSGTGQYAMLRTRETPDNIDFDALNDSQNARMSELQDGGMSFSDASQQAAKETAQTYGMAYYEGSNGHLRRVSC